MKETKQFVAYTADVEGSDIQTLPFPGIRDIKGVRIIASSGVTNGTAVDHSRIGIGYWDGSTHRAMSIQASDNDTTPNCGTRHDTATIIYFINTTTTAIVAEAEVSSVGNEFVKLHWSDYPGTALLLEVTVYYGSNVSCNLHDFTGHGTAGSSQTKTGLAFAPNFLEVMCLSGVTFAADSSFTGSACGLGFGCLQSDGTTRLQGCHTSVGRNLPTGGTAQTGQVLRDDAIAQKLTIAADGTVTTGAAWDVTSYTSDGYVITTRTVTETAMTNPVFAIRYATGERWVAIPSIANSSTGSKSIATSPNFQPHHTDFLASGLTTKNTVTSSTAGNNSLERFSIGGGRVVTQCVASYRNDDGAFPSETKAQANVTLVEAAWDATLTAFTSTGLDINVDSAAASADRVALVTAIGGSQSLTAALNETVQISDAQVFASQAILASETIEISDAQVVIAAGVLASETIEISDAALLLHSTLEVSETVEISDALAAAASGVIASETIEISDAFVFATEASNDLVAVVDETVEISDAEVFAQQWLLQAAETIEISDQALLLHSALLVDEEVQILDDVRFAGTGVGAIVDETVEISDAMQAYLGQVLTVGETIEISDSVNFGEGLVPIKVGPGKGGTVQGGAAAGRTSQGGAERGTSHG